MDHGEFERVFYVGRYTCHTDQRHPVFVKVKHYINDRGRWRLSFTGVEGPKRNGGCYGGCGQIVMHWLEGDRPAVDADFTPDKFDRLVALWDRWHLNDMRSGSPRQEEWLRANPVTAVYPESHYDKACAALAEAGLNPDDEFEHPTKGGPYSYGTGWIYEAVPDDVIDEIMSWPTTTREPAWV